MRRNPLDEAASVGLKPFTYRYKSPHDEPRSAPTGHEYAGVMAQNLEKHPLTAQTVQHTPAGLKVEIPSMVSLLSGMAGRHHDRLDEHEGLLHAHGEKLGQIESMLHKLHAIINRKVR